MVDLANMISTSTSDGETPYIAQGLPIDEYVPDILKMLRNQNILIIQGDTGSGKTTVVPIVCIQDAIECKRRPRIVVCQPRRMACLSITKRVSELLSHTEYKVGHRIMNDVQDSSSDIVFATTGYLVQWFANNDAVLKNVTHIVLDEAHERSVDLDLLALILKRKMTTNLQLKLIIMSATLDVDIFGKYFESLLNRKKEIKTVVKDELSLEYEALETLREKDHRIPTLHVGVKRFHVEHLFLEDLSKLEEYKDMLGKNGEIGNKVQFYLTQKIRAFNAQTNPSTNLKKSFFPSNIDDCGYYLAILLCAFWGAFFTKEEQSQTEEGEVILYQPTLAKPGVCVLVFLPGENEILTFMDYFEELFFKHSQRSRVKIHVLHSMIKSEEQDEVFVPVENGFVKIILSTNIAESSVTITDVTHVIDFGLRRAIEFNTQRGLQQLTLGWASKASAIQRLGRAGRCQPGVCVNIFTKRWLESRPHHELPEIAQISLEGVVLRLKDQFKNELARSILDQLVEPPQEKQVDVAFSNLYESGALSASESSEEGFITFFGKFTMTLPVEQVHAKVLMFGHCFGLSCEGCVLAAALSSQDVFSMPTSFVIRDKQELGMKLAQSFAGRAVADGDCFSDPLSLYNLFTSVLAIPKNERFVYLKTNGVHINRFRQFLSTISFLSRKLQLHLDSVDGRKIKDFGIAVEQMMNFNTFDVLLEQSLKEELSTDVEKLRQILVVGCAPRFIVGDLHKRNTVNYKKQVDRELAVLKEKHNIGKNNAKSKKKKKEKNSEIVALEKQLRELLFTTPSAAKEETEYDTLQVFREFIKPSEIQEVESPYFKKDLKTFSCSKDLESDKQFARLDKNRIIFIKFLKSGKNNINVDAEFIRKKFAWIGVERVLIAKSVCVLELAPNSVKSSFFPSNLLSLNIGFAKYLSCGRDFLSVDVNQQEVPLGHLTIPQEVTWKASAFLADDPSLRLYWRSMISRVNFTELNQPLLGVVASTLGISNGNSYSVAVSGVTLIPIHKRKWKLLVFACLQDLNKSGSVYVEMCDSNTIVAVHFANICLRMKITPQDLQKINEFRRILNLILITGDGFYNNSTDYLNFFEGDDQEEELQFQEFTATVLPASKSKTTEKTEFKFGQKNSASFNFSASVVNPLSLDIVPGIQDSEIIYELFDWPEYQDPDHFSENDDCCSDENEDIEIDYEYEQDFDFEEEIDSDYY